MGTAHIGLMVLKARQSTLTMGAVNVFIFFLLTLFQPEDGKAPRLRIS
jgi:hypothetical protein